MSHINVQGQINYGTVQSREMRDDREGDSLQLSDQRTLFECRNYNAEDVGSTQSESCSVLSSMEPSAAMESVMDNVSLSTGSDESIFSRETIDDEQSQSTAHEADQAVQHDQRYYPQHSFATPGVGTPVPSYANTSLTPCLPTMMSQPHLVQFQLVYPFQQYPSYATQEELTARNTISSGVPSLGNYVPVYWVPGAKSDLRTSMVPTALSTSPMVNYLHPPGYFNANVNAHSVALPTAPLSPISGFTAGNEVGEIRSGNCSYSECIDKGGSNLFISWSGTSSELQTKLCHHGLDVRTVKMTSDVGVFNVIFETHIDARKAFIMQREIKIRMIPPKNSRRNWFRNPSPKFWVKFETRYRLVVKKGKAECHGIVGDLLMSDYQNRKGCIVWADQLKGHRIRIVSCEGNFKFPGGRIVEMKGVRTYSDVKPLGWISYRSRHAKELFVTRRSGNNLEDYIYME